MGRHVAALMLACLAAACSRAQLGMPGTAVSQASPDGTATAYVRNHPSVDPPNQSLWMRTTGGQDVQVARLAEDQDWSNLVVWSADSRRAGFLVQDSRLALVDAATGRLLGWTHLVDDRSDYPTAEVARDLALSADGSRASYRICRRASAVRGVSDADAAGSCGGIVERQLRSD